MPTQVFVPNPIWGLVVLFFGLALALGLDAYLDRRDRRRLFRRGPAAVEKGPREWFGRVEARWAARKTKRKQLRDFLGPFLGSAAVLVRGGVPVRAAMLRAARNYPPNALRTLVEEAAAAGASGEQFFDSLYARAVEAGYEPLRLAVIKLRMIHRAGGDLANALRQSGRQADAARMHELRLAAQQIQAKMSLLAVFLLLPALWIVTFAPLLLPALQSFSAAVR